jgi:hypothetical protein
MRRLVQFSASTLIIGSLLMLLGSRVLCGSDNYQPLPPDREAPAAPGASTFPVAVDLAKVGTYPALVKSGAGYFYDEVLEYRVWIHPKDGGEPLNGGSVYFRAFATYENAKKFSEATKGAETPLVLVRQLEHVNEPQKGVFEHVKEPRVTEWQPEWLKDTKRGPNSIPDFLAAHKKP